MIKKTTAGISRLEQLKFSCCQCEKYYLADDLTPMEGEPVCTECLERFWPDNSNCSPKKTAARVIITTDCEKNCDYCCNTKEMLASATPIKSILEVKNYKEVCITGGEPMLNPDRTAALIEELWRSPRWCHPSKIYLYTAFARYQQDLFQMLMSGLDGLHYTVHQSSDNVSKYRYVLDTIAGIHNIESLSEKFPNKSFRLYIEGGVKTPVTFNPSCWDKVESFNFIKDCPLPKNEDLFILEG